MDCLPERLEQIGCMIELNYLFFGGLQSQSTGVPTKVSASLREFRFHLILIIAQNVEFLLVENVNEGKHGQQLHLLGRVSGYAKLKLR